MWTAGLVVAIAYAVVPAPPRAALVSRGNDAGLTDAREARIPLNRCSSFGSLELVSEAVQCPSECPYSQAFGCGKLCVVADECAVLAPARPFADANRLECRQPCGDTPIPGCARCASPGVCEQCAEGIFGIGWLELADGGRTCINKADRMWQAGYVLLAVLLFLMSVYSVGLWRRPALNFRVLTLAMRNRETGTHRGGSYGFWGPSVEDKLAGGGVPLYFRSLLLLICAAALAGVVASLANPEKWTEPQCNVHLLTAIGREDPGEKEGEHQPWLDEMVKEVWPRLWGPDLDTLPDQLHHAPHRAMLFSVLYLVLTIGGIACFALQRRTRDALHQDFALRLSGVPLEITDAAELKAHIDAFGTPCVGVSICYDFQIHRDAVNTALAGASGSAERDPKLTPSYRAGNIGTQTDEALDLTPALQGVGSDQSSLFDGLFMPCAGVRERGPLPIHGSGYAFAVFPTPAEARRAQEKMNARGAIAISAAKGGKPHRLSANPVACEPSEVYWENYGAQTNFVLKICLGVLAMVGTAVLWLLLSMPYALMFVGQVLTPSLERSRSAVGQEVLLGLMISFGNALVAWVIDRVTDWAGFYEKRSRDLAIFVMAFIGTLFNTLFDLAILIVVAKGATLNAAFEGAEGGYPRVLAGQLFQLIVPGYLFVPVIALPLFERVFPFYFGTWFVRSKPRVLQRDADKSLAHGPFDICWRYADVLNNFTICLALFFLPSGNSWKVMVALVCCFVVVYAIDRYVLLYASVVTPYATHTLYKAFCWMWIVPTMMLVLIVGFWAVHAHFLSSWLALPVMAGVHCIVFSAVMFFFSGPGPVREEPYAGVLGRLPGSYFSTNPVLQLRARVLGDVQGDDGKRLFEKP